MLFVSCQPYENEEYYTRDFILNMAYAAQLGGAKGLRIEGIKNINYVKRKVTLPIIGLIKKENLSIERYICPTLKEIDKIIKTECEYIAIDYTLRDNLDEKYYKKITRHINDKCKIKIIADISTIEEAEIAKECGANYISTALRGYTAYTKNCNIPDINFVKKLTDIGFDNIVAEGGYSTHSEYLSALNNGAKIVVIGTAISRPHLIVKRIITGEY